MSNFNSIIVDSSGLLSLLFETDSNHAKAVSLADSYDFQISKVAIPNEVFSECLNIIGKKFGHTKAIEAGNEFIESQLFFIVDTTAPLRELALEKFKKQSESVSYTDCVVMSLADMWETKYIFGFDAVFKKNGYMLPRST